MGQGVWIDSEKLDAQDSIAEILKHGTLSVGFIGLAETLKALTGKHHGESAESPRDCNPYEKTYGRQICRNRS